MVIENKTTLVAFFFILCVILLIYWILNSTRIFRKNPDVKLELFKAVHGIIFGQNELHQLVYSPAAAEGHCCIFGGSGSGKTSAVLIPTLQSWTGSSFTIDISGDIEPNVHCSHKLVYAPLEAKTTVYNIFGAVDRLQTQAEKDEALEKLAFQLMPESPNMNDAGLFFLREGRKILTAALIAFYGRGADFVPICERLLSSNYAVVFEQIKATQNKKAIKYIAGFDGANEQNTAGCYQACCSAVHLFGTNEFVQKSIRRPIGNEQNLTPAALNDHNVFISIPDEKLESLAPLLHILTAQMLDYMAARSNKEKNTILFCLDEFASLGKLEITPALRKFRKKNVRIMLLTQSLADLDMIYGRNERIAILNNCKFKLVLSCSDVDSQKYFSELSGSHEAKKETTTKSSTGTSSSISYIEQPNIKPIELAKLTNKLILFCAGDSLKLKKNYYFKRSHKG